MLLPDADAVPTIRPAPSRKVSPPLEEKLALPVILPLPSRNVVVLPDVLADPAMRPEPSRNDAFFPTSVRSFLQGSAKATVVSAQRTMSKVFMAAIDGTTADLHQTNFAYFDIRETECASAIATHRRPPHRRTNHHADRRAHHRRSPHARCKVGVR